MELATGFQCGKLVRADLISAKGHNSLSFVFAMINENNCVVRYLDFRQRPDQNGCRAFDVILKRNGERFTGPIRIGLAVYFEGTKGLKMEAHEQTYHMGMDRIVSGPSMFIINAYERPNTVWSFVSTKESGRNMVIELPTAYNTTVAQAERAGTIGTNKTVAITINTVVAEPCILTNTYNYKYFPRMAEIVDCGSPMGPGHKHTLSTPLFNVAPNRPPFVEPNQPKQVRHNRVCDYCRADPIVGTRYTCQQPQCSNLDMCAECFTARKHGHTPMIAHTTAVDERRVMYGGGGGGTVTAGSGRTVTAGSGGLRVQCDSMDVAAGGCASSDSDDQMAGADVADSLRCAGVNVAGRGYSNRGTGPTGDREKSRIVTLKEGEFQPDDRDIYYSKETYGNDGLTFYVRFCVEE